MNYFNMTRTPLQRYKNTLYLGLRKRLVYPVHSNGQRDLTSLSQVSLVNICINIQCMSWMHWSLTQQAPYYQHQVETDSIVFTSIWHFKSIISFHDIAHNFHVSSNEIELEGYNVCLICAPYFILETNYITNTQEHPKYTKNLCQTSYNPR
jgi:hypothetical protein